jgi:hypothetical protein
MVFAPFVSEPYAIGYEIRARYGRLSTLLTEEKDRVHGDDEDQDAVLKGESESILKEGLLDVGR